MTYFDPFDDMVTSSSDRFCCGKRKRDDTAQFVQLSGVLSKKAENGELGRWGSNTGKNEQVKGESENRLSSLSLSLLSLSFSSSLMGGDLHHPSTSKHPFLVVFYGFTSYTFVLKSKIWILVTYPSGESFLTSFRCL